jgi:hypothetical protein
MKAYGDLMNMSEKQIKYDIADKFSNYGVLGQVAIIRRDLKNYKVLIAYMEEEAYEGSSYYLIQNKKTKELFENYASHCSCYGYEDKWEPEITNKEYLLNKILKGSFTYDSTIDKYIKREINRLLSK